ncbi:MAG: hypothetical protein R2873_14975 [Caldilineaceae bacterium]
MDLSTAVFSLLLPAGTTTPSVNLAFLGRFHQHQRLVDSPALDAVGHERVGGDPAVWPATTSTR